MRRIFVDGSIKDDIILSGEEHKHLSIVLRAKVGDNCIICNGDGFDYLFKISKIDKNNTFLNLLDKSLNFTEPKIDATVFFGVLQNSDKMEFIIQKSVELGVNNFTPFFSKYCNSKQVKINRLQKISKEAAKQSGRGKIPIVKDAIKFEDIINELKSFDLVVFAYEKENNCSLSKFFKEYNLQNNVSNKKIAVIVGSEGGFDVDEMKLLAKNNVLPISLGKRILRAETAVIAIVTIVMYNFCELE